MWPSKLGIICHLKSAVRNLCLKDEAIITGMSGKWGGLLVTQFLLFPGSS